MNPVKDLQFHNKKNLKQQHFKQNRKHAFFGLCKKNDMAMGCRQSMISSKAEESLAEKGMLIELDRLS
jgi:hypothetical protein